MGNFADGEDALATFLFIDLDTSTQTHGTTACAHVFLDTLETADLALASEIGAFDVVHQLGQSDVRLIDLRANGVHDFTKVVWGEVGRHANSDTRATIDQEIRKRSGEHGGLGEALVVVRHKIDGLLFQIFHHGHAEVSQTRFGVTHGSRWVPFHRAEVSLAVDQRLTHGPVLTHIDECGINDRLTVRVVVSRGVAANLRALDVLLAGSEVQLAHREKDAPLRWLQSITHVRKGARDDNRHRVVEEGCREFLGYGDRFDVVGHKRKR